MVVQKGSADCEQRGDGMGEVGGEVGIATRAGGRSAPRTMPILEGQGSHNPESGNSQLPVR